MQLTRYILCCSNITHCKQCRSQALINESGYAPGAGVDTPVWQLLAGGPENDTLSAQGDLLIYGNSGPRLAIVKLDKHLLLTKQVLYPNGVTLDKLIQVYYVSPRWEDMWQRWWCNFR